MAEIEFKEHGSSILSKEELQQLGELCALKISDENLVYKASVDGFNAGNFHAKCDSLKNSLTVIKSEKGNIFGGFTAQSWDGFETKRDAKAFLFSFKNENKKPEKFPVDPSKARDAIHCSPRYGPTFGRGFDVFVSDEANKNDLSFSNPYSFLANKDRDYLAGAYKFKVAEIEVYSIIK